ncbi:MAG TPA: hypothetical protein VFI34_07495 [Candidatus Limnocylindrales bacterium]|nr:hypothetical protein [Candidatus Limnocylindrales bacterium]
MSILTDRAERDQAIERIAATSDEVLARDLVDWTVASCRSAEEYRTISERLGQLRELHAEEETWIGLIADEVRRRRDRGRKP